MSDQAIGAWIEAHPVLGTVLALPIVITFCLILLGVSDFSIRRGP
jgi:hypothetical protein